MKQVIVIRKDLNMRKGKMVAQGSHASLMAFLETNPQIQKQWLDNGQTKICVGVNSLEELIDIFKAAGKTSPVLPVVIVRDAGHTELEPGTMTAVGIGPAPIELIDEITKDLKLL